MAMPITEPDCIPQTLSRQLDQILLSRYYFILYQNGMPEEYLVIAEEFLLLEPQQIGCVGIQVR